MASIVNLITMGKFIKYLKNFVIILLIGGLGGVLAERMVIPYLTTLPTIRDVENSLQTVDKTTIINRTENITINEEEGIEKVLSKIDASLVFLRIYKNKVLLNESAAVLVTGDGYLVTAESSLPPQFNKVDVVMGEDIIEAEVIKRDKSSLIAVLKIDKKNLTPVSFADAENIRLAERSLLVGMYFDSGNKFVNLTRIRSIAEESISLDDFTEETAANGTPIVNLKGELIGISLVDVDNNLLVVPVNIIEELL